MSEKVLSQDEVDALLKGVASGEIGTDDAKDKILSGVRNYDCTSQERIIRGKMPGLEMINESFARLFRSSVSSLIMKYIDINVESAQTVKYSDFMKTIPVPSSINIFTMNPLKGYALLVLEAPLVFAFVEFFFGGSTAQYVKSEGRAFTQIEQRVIQRVVNMALKDMATSWGVVSPITPQFTKTEINPQFVSIVTPGEIVINIEVLIEIEDFTGKMFFCIPYSMVEPIKEKLYSGIHGNKFETDQRWTLVMKNVLKETFVNLTAEMASTMLSVEDVLNFEIGNVINLGKSVTDEVTIKIEDTPKLKGIPGYRRGNQAIKITEVIE